MARKSYELNLNGEKYKLRLTMAGQKALLGRFHGQNILAIIMGAADDLEYLEELLYQALNWEGNPNTVHSGSELYDAMVDAGYAGTKDFMAVTLSIAKNAGIITQDARDRLERVTGKAIDAEMDMLLNQLEGQIDAAMGITPGEEVEGEEGSGNPSDPVEPGDAEPLNMQTL